MKKIFFILAVLATMLLCTGVALAAPACDSCGSRDTSLIGTGSWCHWECNKCEYRTSRSHNPNSHNSGLVPDSCAGRCRWCGSSAVFSSHSFTKWKPTGDATCLTDGTETSYCGNAQCSAKTSRSAPGSALGHDYVKTVHRPMCDEIGYTNYTCSRCGDHHNKDVVRALGHLYTSWTSNGDGTHTGVCVRPGCRSSIDGACNIVTRLINNHLTQLCALCGYVAVQDVTASLPAIEEVSAVVLDGTELPGQLVVRVDAAPLAVPIEDAYYMFILSFQSEGQELNFPRTVRVTIDLNKHPFEMEGTIFQGRSIATLNSAPFKLFRVEQETLDGKEVEVWHDVPFTLRNGVLIFDTDKTGVFLLVLDVIEGPSVG